MNDVEQVLNQGPSLVGFDPVDCFCKLLDSELHRVDDFYSLTEKQIFAIIDQVLDDYGISKADFEAFQVYSTTMNGQRHLETDIENMLIPNSPGCYPMQYNGNEANARDSLGTYNNSNNAESQSTAGFSKMTRYLTSHLSCRQVVFSDCLICFCSNRNAASISQAPESSTDYPGYINVNSALDVSINKCSSCGRAQRFSFELQREFDESITALCMRIINSYISLSKLRSFIQPNRTDFSKALKKFDKPLTTQMKERYLSEHLPNTYVSDSGTEKIIVNQIDKVINAYAELVTQSSIEAATRQLCTYLCESVVFDRNTIWRDQMELSRNAPIALPVKNVVLEGQVESDKTVTAVRFLGFKIPSIFLNMSALKGFIISLIFFAIISMSVIQSEPQNRCLAVVVAASLLRALEAMLLFVALLTPILAICLIIPCNADGEPMTAPQASTYIFSCM